MLVRHSFCSIQNQIRSACAFIAFFYTNPQKKAFPNVTFLASVDIKPTNNKITYISRLGLFLWVKRSVNCVVLFTVDRKARSDDTRLTCS